MEMDQENASRRGYLEEDFRLFHLKDAVMGPVDWHYHSFHKILVLLAGRASYAIEGQSYALEPGDVVLVPRGSIHRPEIAPGQAYERYILYIAPSFSRRPLRRRQTWAVVSVWRRINTAMCSARPGGPDRPAAGDSAGLPGGPRLRPGAAGQGPGDPISDCRHPGSGGASAAIWASASCDEKRSSPFSSI